MIDVSYLSLNKSTRSVTGIFQNIVPIIMDNKPAINNLEIHRKTFLGCEYAM